MVCIVICMVGFWLLGEMWDRQGEGDKSRDLDLVGLVMFMGMIGRISLVIRQGYKMGWRER